MEDENGQEMHKSVEEYAGNQELWVNDFLSAWAKMQQNGYEKLEDGPIGYWSHKCCFYREIAFSGNDLEDGEFDEIPDAVECQKMCQETEGSSMSLVNDSNHLIYPSDLLVLLMGKKCYRSNLLVPFMVKNLNGTFQVPECFLTMKTPVNLIGKIF